MTITTSTMKPVQVTPPKVERSPDSAPTAVTARLILEDGSTYEGVSFGATRSAAGEVVFNTGMVGYPESLTDPSYCGQILVCTYPLIGNYGVPDPDERDHLEYSLESTRLQIAGLIVADYSRRYSHWEARRSLGDWLYTGGIPGLSGIDTRALTKKLRHAGTMLGKIEFTGQPIDFHDPNKENLVAKVSIDRPVRYGKGTKRVVVVDSGAKHNIIRSLITRGVEVLRVPWNHDLKSETFDGLMLSNGPGDPALYRDTFEQVRWAIDQKIPTFGVCLGNQMLGLAIGAKTYKLKFGHRSQNQPALEVGTDRAIMTSQNHGFAVDASSLPAGWREWYINLNDGTNEGLIHESGLFRSVQFHPEASPGPVDASHLFDDFVSLVGR
ncbi:MAG TPA: glutamine-hydrolyzing carbamoyl-phosphate synthase small subunit [Phycisphaerales bacterium]|nr:glutamine-hydrolyzing carbamoyl-phosphate synthase small subunit [Phycisphaerales bacterium]